MFETSVIIPTFNNAKFLERCLRSIFAQKLYTNFEVICINDGSTDETEMILKKYKDEIVIIDNIYNRGLPYSLNEGIKFSKSQFIVRVDADDYVSEKFLYFLSYTLKSNPKLNAIACDYEIIEKNGSTRVMNCVESPIACGIIFRRDLLFDIGLYDVNFEVHEDQELMQRFLKKYSVDRLPIPLYRYRMHDTNLTKNLTKSNHYLNKLKKREENNS